MPELLYLVTEDWYFCSHRLQLAEEVARRGYTITVVTNDTGHLQKIAAKGFNVIPLKLPRSLGSPFRELMAIIRLFRIYLRIKPDIIHHVALKPVMSGSIAAWIAGMPRVVNAYTGLGYLFTSDTPVSRFFEKIIAPIMSRLLASRPFYSIVQNQDDEQILLRLGLVKPGRAKLIRGSGVDITVFTFTPEPEVDKPVVLLASRLLRDKGIVEFINAARHLQNNARFVLVGNTDPANPTSIKKEELDGWIKEGIVEWWGHRDDMNTVFSAANIVCLPSYREGLPKVLLEAAACGRAIVTTDVPGCREAVIEGVNGLRVPARDSRSLADAIRTLLQSPDLRRRMGEAGRAHISANFAVDIINSETIKLYDSLIKINPVQN